jgi:hypothetical protein
MNNLVELSLPPRAKEFTRELVEAGALPVGFAVVGGTARQALVEARHDVWQPARDLDVIGLEDLGADMELAPEICEAISTGVNQDDDTSLIPDIGHWFDHSTDFGINATSIIRTEEGTRIIAAESAIQDADEMVLRVTTGAVKRAADLRRSDQNADKVSYSRQRTNVPARGAYLKAVLGELLGRDVPVDMSRFELPSPNKANPFFIGLMLVKSLQVDAMTYKNIHAITYMRNVEQLGIWRFMVGKDAPLVALRGLVRICPHLSDRAASLAPAIDTFSV